LKDTNNNTLITEKFQQMKNDIANLYKKKDDYIKSLEYINNKLNDINALFLKQIELQEQESNKKKFCLHCHQNFFAKQNEEDNCIYHPGVLKYYSCRGCGGDEYHTCCMKCIKCSIGCKKSKHFSEL
jgi:hypothetical protein